MADTSVSHGQRNDEAPISIAERWLLETMLAKGFNSAFARRHSEALASSIRTWPEDISKMEADLSALAGA